MKLSKENGHTLDEQECNRFLLKCYFQFTIFPKSGFIFYPKN